MIPTPSMSLGPKKVTNEERAKEKSEQAAKAKLLTPNLAPKKVKPIPPELHKRQSRAAARMLELGVRPVEASLTVLLLNPLRACRV